MIDFIRYRFDAPTRVFEMEVMFRFDLRSSFATVKVLENNEEITEVSELFRTIYTTCFDTGDAYKYRWAGSHTAFVNYSKEPLEISEFSSIIVLVGEHHRSSFLKIYTDAICFHDDLGSPDVMSQDDIERAAVAIRDKKGYVSMKLRFEFDEHEDIAKASINHWD